MNTAIDTTNQIYREEAFQPVGHPHRHYNHEHQYNQSQSHHHHYHTHQKKDPVSSKVKLSSVTSEIQQQQQSNASILSTRQALEVCTIGQHLQQHQQHQKGSLQLWRFLVTMLDDPSSQHLICWTGRKLEFKLNEPEEVARLWGIQKNRPTMNYDKLSRSLRYYYEKGIISKVSGERYVYRFAYEPEVLAKLTQDETHQVLPANDMATEIWQNTQLAPPPPQLFPETDDRHLIVFPEPATLSRQPGEMYFPETQWVDPVQGYEGEKLEYGAGDWEMYPEAQPTQYDAQNQPPPPPPYEYVYSYQDTMYYTEAATDAEEPANGSAANPYAYFQYPEYI